MAAERISETVKFAKDLAAGFSEQAKHSNRVWLALIAASTLILFPEIDSNSKVKQPFSLGSVDATTYKFVGFLILTMLLISYCQSYSTTHMASRVANEMIAKLDSDEERMEARKLFYLHMTSNLSRVSPLAHFLARFPKISAMYYCLLKFLAVAVIFGVPTAALIFSFLQLAEIASSGWWIYILSLISICITIFAVLQNLLLEFWYSKTVAKMYWNGGLNDEAARRLD